MIGMGFEGVTVDRETLQGCGLHVGELVQRQDAVACEGKVSKILEDLNPCERFDMVVAEVELLNSPVAFRDGGGDDVRDLLMCEQQLRFALWDQLLRFRRQRLVQRLPSGLSLGYITGCLLRLCGHRFGAQRV